MTEKASFYLDLGNEDDGLSYVVCCKKCSKDEYRAQDVWMAQ